MRDEFFSSVVEILIRNGMLDLSSEYTEESVLSALSENLETVDDEQVNWMTSRFLSWRLPRDFSPDGGVSFKAEFNEHTSHPMRYEPTGTNLLNAHQAHDMVRHILALPANV